MKRDNVKKQTNKSSSKKDTQTEENKHSYITNFQSSEAVIKQLLDKIIILAVRSSQAKEIDTQIYRQKLFKQTVVNSKKNQKK